MWNIQGVIPPIAMGEEGHSPERSPYLININDFVKQFALSTERIEILKGFLAYREALYSAGIDNGFQWVNGSFSENIESIANRAPNDIDIVTFSNLNNSISNFSDWVYKNKDLFDNSIVKNKYKVDSYWIDMDREFNSQSIRLCTYWYSMWSHQRDTNTWKGFYVIELTPNDDIQALKYITDVNIESNHA